MSDLRWIVHLGLGGFARAHLCAYVDQLGPDSGWAVCGVGLLPGDARIRDGLAAQNGRYTLLLKHPDGSVDRQQISAVRDYLFAPADRDAVIGRMADPATQIVSLTITEGGYGSTDAAGVFDMLVSALGRRRAAGLPPFTVLSCDNIEENGVVAKAAVARFADVIDTELGSWIRSHVSFPSSMVDRITPATTDADRALVPGEDVPVVAEPYQQWVLEDAFSTGRPPFEAVGVQVVGDVRPYELMKLRLLNGGHQAIGHAGVLLGHTYAHEAAADPLVQRLLAAYWVEARASLPPVPGMDLDDYQRTLLGRYGNPHVADTLARLCAWTSDRIPTFVLPVAREIGTAPTCALLVALWARYVEGVTDDGQSFEVVDQRRPDFVGDPLFAGLGDSFRADFRQAR
ncbi:MAG: mannitol dehydrogenase family protein, partial [Frankiales bacterium]|nr:mannitol dehydrogenase family protein [Frankiales bacterium]